MIVAGGRVTSTPGDELTSVEVIVAVLMLMLMLMLMLLDDGDGDYEQVMVVGQPYWTFKASLPQPRLAPAMVVLGQTFTDSRLSVNKIWFPR